MKSLVPFCQVMSLFSNFFNFFVSLIVVINILIAFNDLELVGPYFSLDFKSFLVNSNYVEMRLRRCAWGGGWVEVGWGGGGGGWRRRVLRGGGGWVGGGPEL